MTVDRYTLSITDSLSLCTGQDAEQMLTSDLSTVTQIYAWAYLLDPTFFADFFRKQLDAGSLYFITDARQLPTARDLAVAYRNFHARSWSTNRTLHDKTLILPEIHVAWLSTYNLTRGSWTMSYNRAARIESPIVINRLLNQHMMDWNTCKPILPIVPTGQSAP